MAEVRLLVVLAGIFKLAITEEICYREQFRISCGSNEVIMMTSAEYGHMTVGRCIKQEDPRYLGCSNDVLPLMDKWCSGQRECNINTRNDELENLNVDTNCPQFILKYTDVKHKCLKVNSECSRHKANQIEDKSGYLSSHVADTKGCGASGSPWIISAKPGQTIQLDLIDFAASSKTSNLLSCRSVYGFILERALGINHTICGGRHREGALYTSKTNTIEVYLAKESVRGEGHFIVEYEVKGCSEVARPEHAWYKREGNEAVIGCEDNDQEWRLTCTGNTWLGEVGSCNESVVVKAPVHPKSTKLQFSSVVIMAGIIGGAIVVSVVAIVTGVVYVNKYRMHQETKRATLHTTYATMDRNVQAYYRPVTMDQSMMSSAGWDMPLPPDPHDQMTSYPDQCTCATLQMRNHGDVDKTTGGTSVERQSLYSSIKS